MSKPMGCGPQGAVGSQVPSGTPPGSVQLGLGASGLRHSKAVQPGSCLSRHRLQPLPVALHCRGERFGLGGQSWTCPSLCATVNPTPRHGVAEDVRPSPGLPGKIQDVVFGTDLYESIIHCLSEILISLRALCFYLLHLAALPSNPLPLCLWLVEKILCLGRRWRAGPGEAGV